MTLLPAALAQEKKNNSGAIFVGSRRGCRFCIRVGLLRVRSFGEPAHSAAVTDTIFVTVLDLLGQPAGSILGPQANQDNPIDVEVANSSCAPAVP
jgi:hypothetical protein